MTSLDTSTELFDLFGQEGTCAVCMEALQQGERVRALRGCDHLFHQACVEPWLLSRGTCPMCRATIIPIQDAPAALSSTTNALETLQGAILSLNPGTGVGVRGILDQIQTLLTQTRADLTTRKAALTYALGIGIAARFTTAAAFNAVKTELRTRYENGEFQFEGIPPHPLVFTGRTAFMNSYRRYWSDAGHQATTARLRAARASSQFLQDFWRTD